MSLSVGIVGLPNAGKSTLFNALLKKQIAAVAEYPFCTIEPNIGVVEVPDDRLAALAEIVGTHPKVVPAAIKFVDIAGLVKGAHKGEGLGNKFLAHIREVDVICQVVREFKNSKVPRAGSTSPEEDIDVVNTELILKDLETVEAANHTALLSKVKEGLNSGKTVRDLSLSDEERAFLEPLCLLTAKPVLYVLNVDEEDLGKPLPYKIPGAVGICARLEADLANLPEKERTEYLAVAGVDKTGLDFVISACYKLLGLLTFFTIAGGKQVQAWPLKVGATVLGAASVVHTDFAKGFIKAEVISFEELRAADSYEEAGRLGKLRTEGKEYLVQDGDVVEFKVQKSK